MSELTTVHLLRHGEVHNPQGLIYGRLPGYRLSETGVLMAKAAARFLADRDIVALFSSPLERTRQTAEPLAGALGLDVTLDERLIEAANKFEGRRFGHGDGALTRPANLLLFRNPLRPSWGEPYVQIAQRMTAAVRAARAAGQGHEVVCVSHQLPIWTMRRTAERKRLWHNPARRECALASVTSLRYDGDQLVGVDYAEPAAAHY